MPLQICAVAAEMMPFAKAGGLADVVAALVKYLHELGHDVRLFIPAYASTARAGVAIQPVGSLQNLSLQLGPYRYDFSVSSAQLPGSGASIYLIDCPACYQRPSIYTADPDEHRRFLLLTHAAFMCCQHMGFAPQIMHFHDWHTAIGALLLRASYAWDRLFQGSRSVLTLHNVGYQGVVSSAVLPEIMPGAAPSMFDQRELAAGRINLLRTGISYADLITTVSPTYAREIQTAEQGMGLDDLLRARRDALVGILNGVDYAEWDPRHDRFLPRHYGIEQPAAKASLKEELRQRLGFTSAPGTSATPQTRDSPRNARSRRSPLIGIVSRLVEQKGFDLLFDALPQLLQAHDFEMVVLGNGQPEYENFFTSVMQRFPSRVHFHAGYDDALAHWIEAASDMFLMPSRYEPCGLNQMYSLRYGSVPIVRRTGGLADSVQQFDPVSAEGTGIVFEEYSPQAATAALELALQLYQQSQLWGRLMRNGMAQDFSWSRQVQRYVEVYERLLAR